MRETLRVAAGIQAREGDDPKESSGCGESRRQTRGVCGKVRKGQKARPLLGFQLSLGHLPLGEEQASGDKSERSAGPTAILNTPSAFADNTACRPPDPGHNWSQGWLDGENTGASLLSLPQLSLDAQPLTLPSFPQPGLRRLRRRDTHFPICIYCCGCCYKSRCGLCCKT